jgi:hypothetical protein
MTCQPNQLCHFAAEQLLGGVVDRLALRTGCASLEAGAARVATEPVKPVPVSERPSTRASGTMSRGCVFVCLHEPERWGHPRVRVRSSRLRRRGVVPRDALRSRRRRGRASSPSSFSISSSSFSTSSSTMARPDRSSVLEQANKRADALLASSARGSRRPAKATMAEPDRSTASPTAFVAALSLRQVLLLGALARLVLFRWLPTAAKAALADRPELSTPLTSFRRLREGVFLLGKGIDPHAGGLVLLVRSRSRPALSGTSWKAGALTRLSWRPPAVAAAAASLVPLPAAVIRVSHGDRLDLGRSRGSPCSRPPLGETHPRGQRVACRETELVIGRGLPVRRFGRDPARSLGGGYQLTMRAASHPRACPVSSSTLTRSSRRWLGRRRRSTTLLSFSPSLAALRVVRRSPSPCLRLPRAWRSTRRCSCRPSSSTCHRRRLLRLVLSALPVSLRPSWPVYRCSSGRSPAAGRPSFATGASSSASAT